jgi:hypothetical protein
MFWHFVIVSLALVAGCGCSLGVGHPALLRPETVVGTYSFTICRGACFDDSGARYASGQFVILDAPILDPSGTPRRPFLQFDSANACFEIHDVKPRKDSLVGLKQAGLTRWKFVESDTAITLSLFRSPDAGYEIILSTDNEGLHGTGQSWIALEGSTHFPTDTVRATRISAADATRCSNFRE